MIKNILSLEEKATNYETMLHIEQVRKLINLFVADLLVRGEKHDQSKMQQPEVSFFTEYTPKLSGVTYNSPEYLDLLEKIKPALEHHYAKNRHHPQHFPNCTSDEIDQLKSNIEELESYIKKNNNPPALIRILARLQTDLEVMESSINNMNISDILEMFVDWKASSMRHNDGNIRNSIESNIRRFGISRQLANILINTIEMIEE